jgi:hypothetical protein
MQGMTMSEMKKHGRSQLDADVVALVFAYLFLNYLDRGKTTPHPHTD